MSTGTNEEGIGVETRPSGECDVPQDESNLLLWIIGIGIIVAMTA